MLFRSFNNTDPEEVEKRKTLLNDIFGTEVNAWIEPPFYFCYGTHIKLQDHVYINMNCTMIDDGSITIGKNVMIGSNVSIITTGHPVDLELRLKGYMYTAPVVIKDNCWIGTQTTICPGVTIGENSVIGAGSVVTKDIPSNVVAVGNPCRVLRAIGEKDKQNYFHDRKISECLSEDGELINR